MLMSAVVWLIMSSLMWLIKRPKLSVKGSLTGASLWAIAFAMCAAVDFEWWSRLDPLGWLDALFAGPTEWVLGKV